MIAVVDDEQTMLKAIDRLLTAKRLCHARSSRRLKHSSTVPHDDGCGVPRARHSIGRHVRHRAAAAAARRSTRSFRSFSSRRSTTRPSIRRRFEAGCVACLRKPFSANSLIGAIDKATGQGVAH